MGFEKKIVKTCYEQIDSNEKTNISRVSNIESDNSQNVGLEDYNISRTSNIAFLMDWAQISDLDFGLIQQNISIFYHPLYKYNPRIKGIGIFFQNLILC